MRSSRYSPEVEVLIFKKRQSDRDWLTFGMVALLFILAAVITGGGQ